MPQLLGGLRAALDLLETIVDYVNVPQGTHVTRSVATTWTIRGHRVRDALAIAAPSDFRVTRAGVMDPEQLWRDSRHSLYCLDLQRREVVFVELPSPEIRLTYPCYYHAQRETGRRLIRLGFDAFHDLVDRFAGSNPPLLSIHSVGRSGSTLVARALEHTGRRAAFSEPDCYTQLLDLACETSERRRWLRHCTQYLCRGSEAGTLAVIKFRSFVISLAPELHSEFPETRTLFLYRNALDYVRSAMQVFRYPHSPLTAFDVNSSWPVLRDVLSLALRINWRRITRSRLPAQPWVRQHHETQQPQRAQRGGPKVDAG